MSFWDDTRIARLKQLHAEHYSASQIAADLGAISRCAVLGKLNRLGLSNARPRKPPGPRVAAIARPPRRRPQRPLRTVAQVAAAPVLRSAPLPTFAAADGSDIPLTQRKTLLELTDRHCRYPFGDPGSPTFFFCAHPSAALSEGRPYCAIHVRLTSAR